MNRFSLPSMRRHYGRRLERQEASAVEVPPYDDVESARPWPPGKEGDEDGSSPAPRGLSAGPGGPRYPGPRPS